MCAAWRGSPLPLGPHFTLGMSTVFKNMPGKNMRGSSTHSDNLNTAQALLPSGGWLRGQPYALPCLDGSRGSSTPRPAWAGMVSMAPASSITAWPPTAQHGHGRAHGHEASPVPHARDTPSVATALHCQRAATYAGTPAGTPIAATYAGTPAGAPIAATYAGTPAGAPVAAARVPPLRGLAWLPMACSGAQICNSATSWVPT